MKKVINICIYIFLVICYFYITGEAVTYSCNYNYMQEYLLIFAVAFPITIILAVVKTVYLCHKNDVKKETKNDDKITLKIITIWLPFLHALFFSFYFTAIWGNERNRGIFHYIFNGNQAWIISFAFVTGVSLWAVLIVRLYFIVKNSGLLPQKLVVIAASGLIAVAAFLCITGLIFVINQHYDISEELLGIIEVPVFLYWLAAFVVFAIKKIYYFINEPVEE